ncbi:MAG: FAD-dependent monooxygenase [Proteobacteria bacterium]|nr:FAD-dependent monooxygenase [Pseudomonadota bacterium]MDA1135108.1 FAD-dependent monooxygenase [Pseudomonadota bacterium]
MKTAIEKQIVPNDYFHKISVIGGGLTGAFMMLLLKKSNLLNIHDLAWIKPKNNINTDLRTSFYNSKNLKLLKELNVLQNISEKNITLVKEIHVFGQNTVSPLIWKPSQNGIMGAIIQNNKILNLLNNQLKNIITYDSLVNNTKYDDFERHLYLKNKTCVRTNLVLSADGNNSNLRKLSSINTISKNTNHIAISGFLRQSKKHDFIAKQVFSKLGPIGLLPHSQQDIVNFVLSVNKNKAQKILASPNPENFICHELNNFFIDLNLTFSPLEQVENNNYKLSQWPLNLNLILNPTSNRIILLGDAAHSIHPLAGQGLNLSIEDCVSSINAIKNNIKFGSDLGDLNVMEYYKKERLPNTLAMTAITDFLFYGFTSDSEYLQSILSKGMKEINKSSFKNIFKKIAGSI